MAGWKLIIIGSTYLCLTANSIAFLDLYLSLKNPFYPRSKRQPMYLSMLAVIMLITSILLYHSLKRYGTSVKEVYSQTQNSLNHGF